MNKTPTNTAALNSLKSQGWNVNIVHWRHLHKGAFVECDGRQGLLIKDKDYRETLKDMPDKFEFWDIEVSHFGGATEIILVRGEEKIVVRADCYVKDRFSRRLGVKAALNKLENLYGIK